MDLFSDDDTTIDPNKDYYTEFVGEGKKYKTNADAGRALAEKDAFIERLKSEMSGLRGELNTRLKLEEALDQIRSNPKSPSSEQEPKAPEQDTVRNESAIKPEDIVKAVRDSLSADEKASQRAKNTAYVEQQLQAAFGPTFSRTIREQAKKLGVGEEFAKNLAAEQPQAFLKLFDVSPAPEVNSAAVNAPRSVVNTQGFQPNNTGSVKRKSHFDAIRKANPRQYWSPAVQNEIHSEARKQGESFFDT